jgi:TP901 family phage tail tape measure protein
MDRAVLVRLKLDNSSFMSRISQSSAAVKTSAGQIDGFARKHEQSMTRVGQASVAMSAAVAAGVALSVRAAVSWQSAWAGVVKTTDGSAKQMAALEKELRGLAKTLPATHEEIAGVAEAAGQLGVKREAIAGFTKTVVALANSTDLSFDEAATSLAQFSNIMQLSAQDFDRLGSTLVDLGNNGASTERDIVQMSLRLAGAGKLVGASADEVLALASSMADLGIEAELGGGAMSRALQDIYSAVQEGGDGLQGFADVAGMSAEQFAAAFRETPVQAVDAFVQGLARIKAEGGNVVGTLDELGISGTQDLSVLLRLTGAGDGLTRSLEVGSRAWEANTALVEEAQKRYETTESKMKIARNSVNDLGISLGTTLLPAVAAAAEGVSNFADAVGGLPEPVQGVLAVVGTLGATAGLLGGAALIAAPKVAALKGALTDMGMSAERADATMQNTGKAARGLAAAGVLLGAAAAARELAMAFGEAIPKSEQLTASLLAFGEDGKVTGEAVDLLGDDMSRFVEILDDANTNTVWSWLKDGATALEENRQKVEAVDQALAGLVRSGHGDRAAEIYAALEEKVRESGGSVEDLRASMDDLGDAQAGVENQSKLTGDEVAAVGDAASQAAPKVAELTEAQENLESVLAGFVHPLTAYQDLVRESAQAVADSTEKATDSWTDYADSAAVSLNQVAERLEADNRAHEQWRDNLVTVAQSAGPEVAMILADMGEEGVRLTAQMADGTEAEVQRMAAALIENAAFGGKGAGVALDHELQVMAAIAKAGGKATVSELAAQLWLGTDQVAAIAAAYGVKLKAGVDPILIAVGGRTVNLNQQPGRTYTGVQAFAAGGVVGPGAYALATGGPVDLSAHVPAADAAAVAVYVA